MSRRWCAPPRFGSLHGGSRQAAVMSFLSSAILFSSAMRLRSGPSRPPRPPKMWQRLQPARPKNSAWPALESPVTRSSGPALRSERSHCDDDPRVIFGHREGGICVPGIPPRMLCRMRRPLVPTSSGRWSGPARARPWLQYRDRPSRFSERVGGRCRRVVFEPVQRSESWGAVRERRNTSCRYIILESALL